MVHHGFFDAYTNLESQMFSAITELKRKHLTSSIAVTGHSFGACLATFAAVVIKRVYAFDKFTFYTFGSPRVGN